MRKIEGIFSEYFEFLCEPGLMRKRDEVFEAAGEGAILADWSGASPPIAGGGGWSRLPPQSTSLSLS